MNGLIVINKESGLTSHDVVNKVRKIFKTKRVGHLGTLDPDAEGVLVICLNDATKLVQFLENDSKEYIAEIKIGVSTDTFDKAGIITSKVNVNNITNEIVDETLKSFIGKQQQVPPKYSAIKKDGKKLYEYARAGIDVEIESREIEIFNIFRINDVVINDGCALFKVRVNVSKGTYIRSLCVDIADRLGYPGLMNSLIRTRSGKWHLDDSLSFKDLESGKFRLFSMLEALDDMKKTNDEDCIAKAKNGMKISASKIKEILGENPSNLLIYNNDNVVAIYHYDDTIKGYRAQRVWN